MPRRVEEVDVVWVVESPSLVSRYHHHPETARPTTQRRMCVYVCVFVRARARARVCVCVNRVQSQALFTRETPTMSMYAGR
jgi:hypothetical protein